MFFKLDVSGKLKDENISVFIKGKRERERERGRLCEINDE